MLRDFYKLGIRKGRTIGKARMEGGKEWANVYCSILEVKWAECEKREKREIVLSERVRKEKVKLLGYRKIDA